MDEAKKLHVNALAGNGRSFEAALAAYRMVPGDLFQFVTVFHFLKLFSC